MESVRTGVLVVLALAAGLFAEAVRRTEGRRRIARAWASATDRV